MQGTLIDSKYQIVRELGKGGMGAVYEARHLGTGRRVAVKVIVPAALASGGDIIPRFQREARASGSIESQHVVQVLDTGVDPVTKSPYMVMEHLTGEDVHQLVGRLGALPPDLVLRIMSQACLGLAKAHQAGIVHRDIKSANIYLSKRDGGETIVKILDFGIAKVRADQLSAGENQGLTRTGSMMGSPLYMSPEQAKGAKDLDLRSDIFSLGVMMYEALSGATPNADCETLGMLIIAIVSEKARPIQQRAPWTPPEVAAIVHRALAPDPADRFQTADDMQAAIRGLLPNGNGLQDSMFVAVSQPMRATVAMRWEQTPWPARIPNPNASPSASTLAISSSSAHATASSFGGTKGQPGAATSQSIAAQNGGTRRVLMIIPAVLVLLGVVAIAGVLGVRAISHKPLEAASPSVVLPQETASTASTPGGAPDARVVVLVANGAKVDVDGTPAAESDGGVTLVGKSGTRQQVHVVVGAKEITQWVAITDDGALPARIDVMTSGARQGAGGRQPGIMGAPVASARAGPSGGATEPAAAASQQPAPPVTRPPPKPGTPNVSREM